ETGKLSYYLYNNGDNKPSSPATTIASFPDYGLSYKYGGWHLTRSLAFYKNKLYVSVGSSCDACIEKEEIRATLVEMDPDGRNLKYYARGLRNAVGIKWINNELWATNMGRDNRGPDKPEEQLMKITRGAFYGWPYYYQYKKQIIADPDFKDSVKPAWVKRPPISKWGIKAHSAPLGFAYFTGFKDSLLNNSFITALHGSTSVWRERGNAVVQMLPNGTYREIVTGFLQGKTEDKRYGRPCDVLQWSDHSFFISDDKNGVIYYVWKEN
ncbi:MAG: PQQ-dependent sugar dehydrogenase, partial [Chitinophagaceae bacterium]|nr:PQQ-dependent sugar dehydrogenase [Chitinophagaceae bacterium]